MLIPGVREHADHRKIQPCEGCHEPVLCQLDDAILERRIVYVLGGNPGPGVHKASVPGTNHLSCKVCYGIEGGPERGHPDQQSVLSLISCFIDLIVASALPLL